MTNSPAAGMNFFDPAFLADPFPMLAFLRSSAPVFKFEAPNGRGMWFITRFEEAVQVLRDARFSSNMYRAYGGQGDGYVSPLGLEKSMIFADGMDHTRLRALVSKGFTPRFIEGLRPRIEALTETLIDQMQPKGAADLMTDFAYPLPINVISDMLGVPQQDQDKIREWSNAIIDQTSDDPEKWQKLDQFAKYIRALIAEKRINPAQDLLSSLVARDGDDDRLSEGEIVGMMTLLIFAGHETTSNLIGNGILALLTQPEQFAKLKADSSLIPNAVEELLRFCGPAFATTPRTAIEDVELGGQVIHAGETVNIIVGSADRDAGQFTDPDAVDVARRIERHLAFGHGVHFCLGAPLARLEGQIAFGALLRRLPDLELDVEPGDLVWRGNMIVRGISSLPVRF